MQNLQGPLTTKVVSVSTATTATTSWTFTAPVSDTYSIHLRTGTGSGTSPTLDMSLQTTPDGGTTWIAAPVRFTQQTTTGLTENVTFRTRLGESEAGRHNTAAIGTGGALSNNFVPTSQSWRLTATITGTSPSFATINAWLSSQPISQR